MKVLVLGGGVIGTSTAYYLAKAGHEVVVVDRQKGPGLETSFANAGEISPGYASPWASPDILLKAIKWLMLQHAPLIVRPHLDGAMIAWLLAMLGNCTSSKYAINKERMVRIAEYSRNCLIELRSQTNIEYDQRMMGTLQLFRTAKTLEGIGKDVDVLRAGGIPYEVLDRAGCIAVEPGLAAASVEFVGGLRLPNDETGDCFKFTSALAELAVHAGVRFHFKTKIHAFETLGGGIVGVRTSDGLLVADRYVVALGSYSPLLIRNLGLRLPVYPVKGYSITAPIADFGVAPVSTLMDESYKVAITRLGDRVRVGGMAELSGFSDDLPIRRRATLEHSIRGLFPGAGNYSVAKFWSGLRPMTPDGTPVIGGTPYKNLYLNTGHGTLGWTMACGSARILSDLISQKNPDIDTRDLSITRYHK